MAPKKVGISVEELTDLKNDWNSYANAINQIDVGEKLYLEGAGSRTFLVTSEVPTPAKAATKSIGKRISDLAQAVNTLSKNIDENDKAAARDINKLSER